MKLRIARPCFYAVLSAAVLSLVSQGAHGYVLVSLPVYDEHVGKTFTFESVQTRTIRRLTTNKVNDKNIFLSGDTIYWERFGGVEGDTEVFSCNILTGKKTRLTKNKLNDTLQAAGVWIGLPYIVPKQSTTATINTPRRRNLNPLLRRPEVYTVNDLLKPKKYTRLTHNKLLESSVKVSDNPDHGMVWLGLQIPFGNPENIGKHEFFADSRIGVAHFGSKPYGHNVFWYDGISKKTSRLTDTSNATSVAFSGTTVAWGTTAQNELVLHDISTGTTRSVSAESPTNIEVSGPYVKYETPAGSGNLMLDSTLQVDMTYKFAERVMVYDTVSDTTIAVGDNPALGYYRDTQSELSGQYVAYNRSFINPVHMCETASIKMWPPIPKLTELRLFDIDTMTDILITEGRGIAGLQVDDTTFVWEMFDTSAPSHLDWDLEIFAYDILTDTIRQVTDNKIDDFAPQISGDLIAWQSTLPDGKTEVFYEVTTEHFVLKSDSDPMLYSIGDPLACLSTSCKQDISGLPASDPEVVVMAVPEPASVLLISIVGLAGINRRKMRRSVA